MQIRTAFFIHLLNLRVFKYYLDYRLSIVILTKY